MFFSNVTYVLLLYSSFDDVVDKHICIWQLNTINNKFRILTYKYTY
jgi:hypothetical protein